MKIQKLKKAQEKLQLQLGPEIDKYADFEELSKTRDKQFDENFNKIVYYCLLTHLIALKGSSIVETI